MKTFALALAFLAFGATGAQAWIETIQVEPFRPARGDSITVTIRGMMRDSCWFVNDQHCGGAGGRTIDIEIGTYDVDGRLDVDCMMVLKPYEVVCRYRLPTAGPYTVTVTELCDSLYPCQISTASGVFETRGPAHKDGGVEFTTWDALKSRYR